MSRPAMVTDDYVDGYAVPSVQQSSDNRPAMSSALFAANHVDTNLSRVDDWVSESARTLAEQLANKLSRATIGSTNAANPPSFAHPQYVVSAQRSPNRLVADDRRGMSPFAQSGRFNASYTQGMNRAAEKPSLQMYYNWHFDPRKLLSHIGDRRVDRVRQIVLDKNFVQFTFMSGIIACPAYGTALEELLVQNAPAPTFKMINNGGAISSSAWASFLASPCDVTISGVWDADILPRVIRCLTNVQHLCLADICSPLNNMADIAPIIQTQLRSATIDAREFENPILLHNLCHFTLRYFNEHHRPASVLLLVSDFPRSADFDDYYYQTHLYVQSSLTILVGRLLDDDVYHHTLKYHGFHVQHSITYGSKKEVFLVWSKKVYGATIAIGFPKSSNDRRFY